MYNNDGKIIIIISYSDTILLIIGKIVRVIKTMNIPIDHFTVVCLVAWPLNEGEAGGDFALIETFLLFLC